MKRVLCVIMLLVMVAGCWDDGRIANTTALDEQAETEKNQQRLLKVQPPPKLTWSLERDQLIKRFKLQNDRTISFFMYVFLEGVPEPIGYYQINKVSSVNSQLTNTQQIVWASRTGHHESHTLPSPAEDGSYGENGQGVFGFTPEDIYMEHNMKYIVSSVPLSFPKPTYRLGVINTKEGQEILEKTKAVMKTP